MTPEQTKLLLDIKFLAEQLQHETTLSKVNQILEIEKSKPLYKPEDYYLTFSSGSESDPNNLEVSGKD